MNYYNNNSIVFLDGKYIKASDASCSMYAQTLHYGYGMFEGLRAYNTAKGTKIFKAEAHFERLKYSAKMLHVPFHYEMDEMIQTWYTLLEKNNLKDAYIRPLLFAKEPNMMLTPPKESCMFIAVWEWGKYLGNDLLRLVISSYERPSPKSFPMEAKASGLYVNSTLATAEAKEKGYDEALLLDQDGNIAEGPGANFFYEKDGVLFTPPRGKILPGITRNTIIELARELSIPLEEKHFTFDAVKGADGAFFTGTAAEIAGIASINDIPFKLDFEKTMGARLSKRYKDVVMGL
jgi:branched-chain amino acid aminotransferase